MTPHRSIVPVPPNVAPTINVELEVENGEVENYEVGNTAVTTFCHVDFRFHLLLPTPASFYLVF